MYHVEKYFEGSLGGVGRNVKAFHGAGKGAPFFMASGFLACPLLTDTDLKVVEPSWRPMGIIRSTSQKCLVPWWCLRKLTGPFALLVLDSQE